MRPTYIGNTVVGGSGQICGGTNPGRRGYFIFLIPPLLPVTTLSSSNMTGFRATFSNCLHSRSHSFRGATLLSCPNISSEGGMLELGFRTAFKVDGYQTVVFWSDEPTSCRIWKCTVDLVEDGQQARVELEATVPCGFRARMTTFSIVKARILVLIKWSCKSLAPLNMLTTEARMVIIICAHSNPMSFSHMCLWFSFLELHRTTAPCTFKGLITQMIEYGSSTLS